MTRRRKDCLICLQINSSVKMREDFCIVAKISDNTHWHYIHIYINKEKCDNFSYKKMMSEGDQTAMLHENICERAKKNNNVALCSC